MFHSVLKSELKAFLDFKHGLGFGYVRAEETLRHFDRHVCRVLSHGMQEVNLQALVESWMTPSANRKRATLSSYLGIVRQFCLFRRRFDPGSFVPTVQWVPQANGATFVPYIFSRNEIRRLLRQIAQLRGSPLQRKSARMLLLVLYCTGLRFGEAARLQVRDLDLRRRIICVRESKGRTRLIPFGSDLAREFGRYLRQCGRSPLSLEAPLLISFQGKRLSTNLISWVVRQWLRRAGMKSDHGRSGPRPYDLRHSFAVHRLSRWYRQGIAVAERLPWLSVYMGHLNLLGTETYLTATPELMALASRRFEARFRRRQIPT
jgi:integrase/recombinase XerD